MPARRSCLSLLSNQRLDASPRLSNHRNMRMTTFATVLSKIKRCLALPSKAQLLIHSQRWTLQISVQTDKHPLTVCIRKWPASQCRCCASSLIHRDCAEVAKDYLRLVVEGEYMQPLLTVVPSTFLRRLPHLMKRLPEILHELPIHPW